MKATVFIDKDGNTKISLFPESHLEKEIIEQVDQAPEGSVIANNTYGGMNTVDKHLEIYLKKGQNN